MQHRPGAAATGLQQMSGWSPAYQADNMCKSLTFACTHTAQIVAVLAHELGVRHFVSTSYTMNMSWH